MRVVPSEITQIIKIYKAPQKGKGQKLLIEGFQPIDFPLNLPYVDGNAYFAGPNDRSIEEEYNQSYGEGILEVAIDAVNYTEYFKPVRFISVQSRVSYMKRWCP